MKIIIGSASSKKIESAKKVLSQFFGTDKFTVEGYPAKSLVSETPFDKETFDGSLNRAKECFQNVQGADIYLGVESGLVERYGHIYEEAWVTAILADGKEYYGYSSGLKVPDYILKKMDELKMIHQDVMILLEKEHGLENSETWGSYSGGAILRTVSLEEALRNAIIQAFPTEKSFYNKIYAD